MVSINEWLPNPAGLEAPNEWVELWNGSEESVNLSGWALQAGDKQIKLSGTLSGGEYAVFKRTSTKLVLRNADEELFLYNKSGNLIDTSRFFGSAPEGKSFARVHTNEQMSYKANELFVWAEPTPSSENKATLNVGVARNTYAAGVALNPGLDPVGFFGLLLGTSVALAGLLLYAFKKHENLSKLFFGRDEAIR